MRSDNGGLEKDGGGELEGGNVAAFPQIRTKRFTFRGREGGRAVRS